MHKMPNTRRSSRRNGGEIPYCHGYAGWRSFRETQIACLVQENGEIITLSHDYVGLLSDLLVGLEDVVPVVWALLCQEFADPLCRKSIFVR